ncbi:MAG: DNA gyrase subunit A [Candidatus Aminicenantes bacterium]|nr:DNA gyrase subunit A [Candidatus Aminicenantes bacterium]NIM78112.1 DNA gyrase subunit A [Candidatus Aminicenantes bacterium]NIN17430.1 DNA gyrase subunit A [Candidatus Aminicenantes bacterium]NIN41326.1 DNA gyrase subunit A [Candidatus Aminicenantes bacterium]NIN84096.1 DNA gyrase subunit A [Candidatus Aminicenantes bacterium]
MADESELINEKKKKEKEEQTTEAIDIKTKIEDVTIEKEMKTSYLDYSMSVIIGRAIPDIRDGLKPVHRRTLYSLHQTGTHYNQPYKKSARIVGDVIGKYHPHGDTAVYDTLVRMAQDFSLRYPLVDGQGNFGSIDNDPPAAMRYTEVRLAKISNLLLTDIDKDTVNFLPNYDESMTEPEVFPSLLPMLLLNGSSGIAVGMATSVPPHNLKELIDAFVYFVENRDATPAQLMEILKGPDFPTGGIIYGKYSLQKAYETGKGTILVRTRSTIETDKSGRQKIIITEIPYLVNKAKIVENIGNLVKSKKISGISDLRDESDREGMRIVIELRRDEIPEVVLNNLFKYTQLQTSFSINLLAIANNQPIQFSLKEYFNYFLGHRKEIVRRRSLFELDKAEKRAHIIEGLKIALDKLDLVIKIIRGSKNRETAKTSLMDQLPLTSRQTDAILEMQLYRLTGLEIDKLESEYVELLKTIDYLKQLLSSERMLLDLIKEELLKAVEDYKDKRRTTIIEEELQDIDMEDLIKAEDFVISVTKNGYIKRTSLSAYKIQRRGAVGRKGFDLKEADVVSRLLVASAHDYILVFTEKGRMFWKKVYEIPEADTSGRGKPISRLIGISDEEMICSVLNVKEFSPYKYVMLFTREGYVKKTSLSAFSRPRINGIIAADVREGDSLFEAQITEGDDEIILGTSLGKSIRFHEWDVREIGRTGRGVIGIRLDEGDVVVGADIIKESDKYILTATENGFGKKSELSLYRIQSRGGKGLINIRINERLGKAIGLVTLREKEEFILSSEQGKIIKQDSSDIRAQGRATQGVKIINIKPGDKLVTLEKVRSEAGDDENNHDNNAGDPEEQ